ncbi:MAG TPA: type II CRISPR RNA-guided endonuclease Cas9 [Pyrinomonadaceae bacterium]|nr:type II CRISPR RNA-guided endonuclease Cas9 [Pyrinomonadaceae bacterium]
MSPHKLVLGLDLGVTSIGWSLIQFDLDEAGKVSRSDDGQVSARLVGTGVRIFPATTEDKTNEPKNAKRRTARGQRRLVMRKAKRRNKLRELLSANNLLPAIDSATSASEFHALGDPYDLRVLALDQRLEPYEVGRTLYHLSKRRGFKSNRKSGESKEDGVVLGGIKEVKEKMEAQAMRTVGEYLRSQEKKRKHFTQRDMIEDEFEAIWQKQASFHPTLLTDELKKDIHNAIFYQRPLKSQRGLIGKCTFEKDKKRCDLARQEAQRLRYWQDINNLQLQDPTTLNWRPLTLEEKGRVAAKLENTKELTYKGLRKLLKVGEDVRINLEANDKKFYGNKSAYTFRKAIGERWDAFNDEEQNRLVEELFRIEDEDALGRRLGGFWAFGDDEIEKLKGVWHQLEDGYSRLSLKAIRKVLPKMIDGLRYDEAVREIYGDHRKQFGGEEFQKLQLPSKELRNPIVFKALCEVRKVVNAIIREYGLPAEIRVEMARDLKLTKLQKEQSMKQANANKRANEEAEDFFKRKFNLENISGTDKLKYRLWKESGERCPYTGNPIPPESLLDDGLVDLEHIIPYSRCFDDSYMNKTICDAKYNREVKRNRAPGEYLDRESEEYAQLMRRVSLLPFGKQRKFKLTSQELETNDWAGRQLSDTRYICREVRGYLRQLYPHSPDENKYVSVVAGGATAQLRHVWHVNAILSDGDIEVKNRWDHRHHAIDAIVVALCDRSLFQRISKLAGRNRELMKRILSGFSEPWPGFLTDVETAMNSLVVSHAPTRRIRGQLLEETAYGPTSTPGVYVVKKSLEGITDKQVKNIADRAIKEIVELRLSQFNGDSKKAFVEPLLHKDGKTPIRNVRVLVTMSPETVVGIKNESGEIYKYYPLAGNHHVDIYENADGERRAELVPRFYAAQRNWKPRDLGPEWRKLFSLCANDYVEFRGDDGELTVYRIQKMSGGGTVVIIGRPLEDARSEYVTGVVKQLQGKNLKNITRKLQVDPIGRLSKASD